MGHVQGGRRRIAMASGIVLVALAAGVATVPAGAGAAGEAGQAATEFDAWVVAIADEIRGVEFDENDVRVFLEHGAELEDLDLDVGEDEGQTADGFRESFAEIHGDPIYLDWAESVGLAPDRALRAMLRLQMMVGRDQAAAMRETWEQQRVGLRAQIEARCKEVDPATCAEMREGLETGIAMSDAIAKSWAKVPQPTAAERALLDRYGEELAAVFGQDEWDEELDDEWGDGEFDGDDEAYDEDDEPI